MFPFKLRLREPDTCQVEAQHSDQPGLGIELIIFILSATHREVSLAQRHRCFN